MRMRLLALAGATLIATLPLTATTASAATKCPSGKICTWTKPKFGGKKYTYNKESGCHPRSGRSVSNQSGKRITLYKEGSCYGARFEIKPGHYTEKTPWPVQSMAVWG
ncbi:peptidase inhibitor family I36 protein [Streptomyces sp. NPDC012461]|uniref:peptidase inhibitor family I36 protein n=1 Tax=Streptomyces sp. NPDC012461 TaxID=3155117 RepID=UPI0033E544BA